MKVGDPEVLERFTAGLIAWLLAERESFRPPAEHFLDPGDESCLQQGPHRKAFGELGGALRVANRVPALAEREDFRALKASWLRIAAEQHILFDVESRLGLFTHNAALFSVMCELDPPGSDSVRQALQNLIDRGYVDRMERSAWNKLDLRYYLGEAGLRHSLPDARTLFEATSLASRPELPYVTNRDLYAITHIVFDLTGFGAADPRDVLGDQARCVGDYVRAALLLCCAERSWDLLAELLMCRIYLGEPDEIDGHVAAQIFAAQHARGFVPKSAAAACGNEDPSSAPFADIYHTSVVGLFLVAAIERSRMS